MNSNGSDLGQLALELSNNLNVKTRRYFFKTYPECFIGSEAADWLVEKKKCTRPFGIAIMNELLKGGYISHTNDNNRPFLDGHFFYFFSNKLPKQKKKLKSTELAPKSVKEVAQLMNNKITGVDRKDRKYHLKTYKNCFVASEGVDWLLKNLAYRTREEAIKIGEKLVDQGFIEHVVDPQPFRDAYLFFRFTKYARNEQEIIEESETGEEGNRVIGIDDFETIKVLGEGGYGKVSLVKRRGMGGENKYYAMKVIRKSKIKSQKAFEHIINEKKVLINDSPFLLHLHFAFQSPNKIYLITDFLPGGDLFFHLSKKHPVGFSISVSRFFCAEIVLALEHLHQSGVIYRDLKLENVLLDKIGHICLADFGLSKVLQDDVDYTQTFCGSQGYFAPEILKGESYSYSVDWFSLGVILYEMISGTNPFLGGDFRETCRNILHKSVIYPPTIFPRPVADFLSKLLAKDPNQRIQTAAEIKREPWFIGLNWRKLLVKKIQPPFKMDVNLDSTEHFDEIFTRMVITTEDRNPSYSNLDDTQDDNSLFNDFDYVSSSIQD